MTSRSAHVVSLMGCCAGVREKRTGSGGRLVVPFAIAAISAGSVGPMPKALDHE
jgi:hypothetical protein